MLGVVALLVAILIPVVSGMRESARRELCTARLKQLGQACAAFASDKGGYPGCYTYRRDATGLAFVGSSSIHVGLLPYLEQMPLYASLNLAKMQPGLILHENHTASLAVLHVFQCPSDVLTYEINEGTLNFRINQGRGGAKRYAPQDLRGNTVSELLADHDGAFAARPTTPVSEYVDGTSQTLAFSEKLIGSGEGIYHPWRDWVELSSSVAMTSSQWVRECQKADLRTSGQADGGSVWFDPSMHQTGFLVSVTPNSPLVDCGLAGVRPAGVFAARSQHPGGVNGLMLDGSVRFMAYSIDPAVWSGLGTRAGAEPVQDIP